MNTIWNGGLSYRLQYGDCALCRTLNRSYTRRLIDCQRHPHGANALKKSDRPVVILLF